jgi:fatty-acid desaturase
MVSEGSDDAMRDRVAKDRHTTFCINSLAHWTGLQPYTEEVTARGNLVSYA